MCICVLCNGTAQTAYQLNERISRISSLVLKINVYKVATVASCQ